MASYRSTMRVQSVRPGVDPADVLTTATAAVASCTDVEHSDVAVTAGEAHIVVRFVGVDDAEAARTAAAMGDAVLTVARADRLRVLRRTRGRWTPVSLG